MNYNYINVREEVPFYTCTFINAELKALCAMKSAMCDEYLQEKRGRFSSAIMTIYWI